MIQDVNVNFRMNRELKHQMEELCDELGLSLTTAFTIFAKKICLEKKFLLKFL